MPPTAKHLLAVFFAIITIFAAPPEKILADDGNNTTDAAAARSTDPEPWGFKKRFGHYGFEFGFAKQLALNKSQTSNTELFSFRAQYVTRLWDPPRNPVLYRLDLAHEGAFTTSVRPRLGEIYGFNEVLRFDLVPWGRSKRVIFYLDAGAGVSRFDLRVPELTGKFQFSLQAGLGFKYRPKGGRAAYGCKFAVDHFSDAGIRLPNQGINAPRVSCGIDVLPKR